MRKPEPQPDPVPISIPLVVLDVREDGTVTVTVDGKPLDPDPFAPPWRRSSFGQIIDRATNDRTVPARVEVREADGTTFTDIIAARRRRSRPEPEPEPTASTGPVFHTVEGEGFVPGEDVAVAVVTGHTDAAHTGTARPHRPGRSQRRPGRRGHRGHPVRPRLRHHDHPASAVNERGRQTGSFGDELTNAAMIGLVVLFGVALILRAAGSVAAFLTGTPQPAGDPASGVGVLFRPGDPAAALDADGLNPVVYWIVAGLLLAGLVTGGLWAWLRLRRHTHRIEADPRRMAGIATRHEVAAAASDKALLRRAGNLRPGLADPKPADVGYRLGTSKGTSVWASVEDSIMVIGPPRSGKGLHLVIPAILDAPGAVVVTSTRPDNLTATMRARRRIGPVAIFDPQHLAEGLPAGLRWSPIRGCESPQTGMIRATGLAAGTGLSAGGVDGGGFWEGKTRAALQALLHAAAIDHRPPAELFRWTLDPTAAADAVAILTGFTQAATGWAESLEAMIDSNPRTRDSIWQGVSLALGSLADPRVLDAVSPGPGEGFDPEAFIRDRGTLFLLATGSGAGASAALVAALVEDLIETARRLAARSAGARLDPPMLLTLDEIANLSPLPSLPTLMAEGGGSGITTMPVLQSLAQARDKWNEHQANAIWDASIVKVILGGASNSRDLQDLSALVGERDEYTDSVTLGDHGSRSNQRSVRRVPIFPPDRIRRLPFGTGIVLLRSAPPTVTDLHPWPKRPDAGQLTVDRAEIEALLRRRDA